MSDGVGLWRTFLNVEVADGLDLSRAPDSTEQLHSHYVWWVFPLFFVPYCTEERASRQTDYVLDFLVHFNEVHFSIARGQVCTKVCSLLFIFHTEKFSLEVFESFTKTLSMGKDNCPWTVTNTCEKWTESFGKCWLSSTPGEENQYALALESASKKCMTLHSPYWSPWQNCIMGRLCTESLFLETFVALSNNWLRAVQS